HDGDGGANSGKCKVDVAFDSSVFNIIEVACDNAHWRIKVNGVERVKSYDLASGNLMAIGRWASFIATNNARIASSGRSSARFGGIELKALGWWPYVLTREESKRVTNYLSDKYAIEVTNYIEE